MTTPTKSRVAAFLFILVHFHTGARTRARAPGLRETAAVNFEGGVSNDGKVKALRKLFSEEALDASIPVCGVTLPPISPRS